ncbi:MAG: PAAR domain-containing protein [Deltaproteobacteria bacterium]|jgi:uncharacterized Zn-binding protein involved in type VI secretion|nr:PAAR domain-containing protein [Deltaproteobacteria bacterium]MBW2531560.1 PAAR domain-containing protein [Deltaproteobacteria bacterium]
MGGKPQARLTDANVHPPVVITGSPDVIVCHLPAARLNDVTAPCPVCGPPTPPGKIVTSSSTVFINRMGAARVSDKVACGAGGAPPGGCSHPPAKGYQVRSEDSYEKMMKGEHESSEFDEVADLPEEKQDGSRDQAQVTAGIPAAGGRSAARAPGETTAQPPSSAAQRYQSDEHPNPWGLPMDGSSRTNAGELQGGDIRPQVEKEITGRHSIGLGEHSAGAKFGKSEPQPEKKSWWEKVKSVVSFDKDDEERRVSVTFNVAGFSLELSFGKRSGKAGYGGAPNAIAAGCGTVIVG